MSKAHLGLRQPEKHSRRKEGQIRVDEMAMDFGLLRPCVEGLGFREKGMKREEGFVPLLLVG